MLFGTLSEVYPAPEVLIGNASSKFDEEDALIDQRAREVLAKMLAGYDAWLEKRGGERLGETCTLRDGGDRPHNPHSPQSTIRTKVDFPLR